VTVQAEVLELLRELRDDRGMAIVFVSHDLAVIAELCDRVAIMLSGEVVEQGPTGQVIAAPRHDYTRELLAAVPRLAEGAGPPGLGSDP
jgi:ABC-type dipeptide/oligopeptide/nickel transport system ATPase component